eukprot:scaffold135898_cov50-Prasinocladus_malaysianus.AAC.2
MREDMQFYETDTEGRRRNMSMPVRAQNRMLTILRRTQQYSNNLPGQGGNSDYNPLACTSGRSRCTCEKQYLISLISLLRTRASCWFKTTLGSQNPVLSDYFGNMPTKGAKKEINALDANATMNMVSGGLRGGMENFHVRQREVEAGRIDPSNSMMNCLHSWAQQ